MIKKMLCIFLSLALLLSFSPIKSAAAQTTSTENLAESAFVCEATSINVAVGALSSGETALLRLEDRQSVELSSDQSGNLEFTLVYPASDLSQNVLSEFFRYSLKASIPTAASIFCCDGSNYDLLGTISVGSAYANYETAIANLSARAQSGAITLKIICTADSPFVLYIDSAVIFVESEDSLPNRFIETYSVSTAETEYGSSQSAASNLKNPDGNFYSVSSENKKAAWTTTVELNRKASSVNTLQIDYSGYCNTNANNIWLSLYNFTTNSWQAVTIIPCNTEKTNKSVYISNRTLLSGFIRNGRLKIRLYNSASSDFVRYSDYLSVKVYADSELNVEKALPKSVVKEYGDVMTGNVEQIKRFDDATLKITSDSQNKVALKTVFDIETPKNKIHTLTVNLRTFNTGNTNNLHVSLLNQNTQSFNVFKEVRSENNGTILSFSLTSPEQISGYVSSSGEITVRVYNSASSSFARFVDYIEVLVEEAPFSSFDFACIADVHAPVGSANLAAAINDINTNVLPSFTIDLGDMTSHGKQSEYDKYISDIAALNGPLYLMPGNHENRWWNSNGKSDYYDNFGSPYRSFDYNGVHFVVLDTTIYLSNDGKVTKEQLDWLKQDLAAIPDGTPVMLFGHHPFTTGNDITARDELFEAIKSYNVVAYICGHTHTYGKLIDDGIPVFYVSCLKDDSTQPYISVSVSSREFRIYKHKASDLSKSLWYTGKMQKAPETEFTASPISFDSNGNVNVSVTITNAPEGISSARARIDNYGTYTNLVKISETVWSGTINVSSYHPSLPKGKHFVGIEVFDGNSDKWTNYYEYTDESATFDTLWEFQTGSAIQSSPTYYGGNVYFGSLDGYLYSVNAETGALNYKFQTGGSVISKPLVTSTNDTSCVVFGSDDKYLYCINANTGELIRKTLCGGSVISDPTISGDRIIFGCGDGKIYCVSKNLEETIWTYNADGLMRHSPVVKDGVVYAIVRNTYMWYAINLSDGTLLWRGNAETDDSYFVCGDISPMVTNGKMWCVDAMSGMLCYLNTTNGLKTWSLSALTYGKTNARSMASNGNIIYFVSNSGKTVHAINSENNSVLWTVDLRYNSSDSDKQAYMMDCGLLYRNGLVIHVAERGRITLINSSTGAIVDSYDAVGYPERALWSTPEAYGNKIFACGIDGKVYCIEYNPIMAQ